MSEILAFIIGAMLSSIVTTIAMCCVFINKKNYYEEKIIELKKSNKQE